MSTLTRLILVIHVHTSYILRTPLILFFFLGSLKTEVTTKVPSHASGVYQHHSHHYENSFKAESKNKKKKNKPRKNNQMKKLNKKLTRLDSKLNTLTSEMVFSPRCKLNELD